jgi:hypothetical protein
MAVEGTLSWLPRLLLRIALWVVVVRDCRRLFRLGWACARAVRAFRRRCWRELADGAEQVGGRRPRRRPRVGWGSLFPVRGYLALFRVFPPADVCGGEQIGKRLRRQYEVLARLVARGPRLVHPLTAGPALWLQGAVVARCFWTVLDLDLSAEQRAVLAGYGSAARALLEFLEFAGCPERVPSYELLPVFLPLFVAEAGLRQERELGRQRFCTGLLARARALGALATLWPRAVRCLVRLYWDWEERHRRGGLRSPWKRASAALRRAEARWTLERAAVRRQGCRSLLAWAVQQRAVELLLQASDGLRREAVGALRGREEARGGVGRAGAWVAWKRLHDGHLLGALEEIDNGFVTCLG